MLNANVNRKVTLSILMMMMLVCGLSGVSYGEDAITVSGFQCEATPFISPGLADVTVKGTILANRDVKDVRGGITINGKLIQRSYAGGRPLGDLSAGETKSFSITEKNVLLRDGDICGYYFQLKEVNPPPETDPTPAQQSGERDEPGDEQPEETSKVCQVGDVLTPGESCTYPGTDLKFSVLDNGSGRFLGFTGGTGITVRNATVNNKKYHFVASKRGDGNWEIEEVAGETAPSESKTKGAQQPDLVVPSVRVSDTTVSLGESFTLSATVKNRGSRQSNGTTLRYYRSTDNRISSNDTEVRTDSIGALGVNRTSDESISLTAPTTPGTYYYGACVDSVTNESDTNNNCSNAVKITVRSSPKELAISSGNNQSGTLNSELTDPLVVRVLDADGNGVANVRVTFRVTAGQGRLSSRGNGRSVGVSTNSRGFAEASLTPTGAGILTIRASVAALDPVTFTVTVGEPPAKLVQVSGGNQHGNPGTRLANPFVVEVQDKDGNPAEGIRVTFRVIAGGGSLSAMTVTTGANGQAQTFLTLGETRAVNKVRASVSGIDTSITFSTSIEPRVLIAASERPAMYWVDIEAGTLHRLVGAKVENRLPSVKNATSLIVDAVDGKLYWTERISDRTGRIRRANLDGNPNVELVKDLTSAPLDIVLDTVRSKLYLTNAWGKVQRMNLDGSDFQPNLITGLAFPKYLTLDATRSKLYWTDGGAGKIQRANLDGSNVEDVVTGLKSLVGIALDTAGGKIYWADGGADRIQRANLDGSNVEDIVTGLKSLVGIALDVGGDKMYWTNVSAGKIQRANLDGSNVEDVVTGFYNPEGIALDIPSQVIPSTPDPTPDLVVEAVQAEPATVPPGGQFRLYATLKNQGAEESDATTVRYYRSTDAVISTEDVLLGRASRDPLAVNATIRRYRTVTAPTTPGIYYYGVCVDSVPNESDTGNNCSKAVSVAVTASPAVSEDVNDDGVVDVQDLVSVAERYGQTGTNSADVNGDGVVNIDDLVLVAAVLDADAAAAPSLHPATLELLTVENVQLWLSQAHQRDLADPSVRRGILFLEQLLASMVPKETILLANYPNPFNPETWIPYQLATSADVSLTIYDVRGVVVRQLALGHQPAGLYQSRSRAAHWDGRNEFGESVASGVYFYTLTAGDFTATRKMLIRK